MDTSDYQEIRGLFDYYIRMYSTRDDLLTTYFSDDFSGITGSGDYLVKDRDAWIAVTRQDFAQVKDPINIDLKDLSIQLLAETIAVTSSTFVIHLPIEEHILSKKIARLVLIFRKECTGWKICHSSISVSFGVADEGEIYPLKDLEDRNRHLEAVVAERTGQLSEANTKLKQANEDLAREIEGHKQSQIANERLLLRQRAILDNLPMMAWLKDTESRLEMINEPYARACGRPVEECIGKTDLELFPREMAQKFLSDDRDVCVSGVKKHLEELIPTTDGTRWHFTCKTPLFDEVGRTVGTTGVALDITERKQAEKALIESEERFRSLMENIPNVAVQGYALDGTVLFWNRASEILYGYSAREALGANLLDLIIPAEMKDGVREAISQMYESCKPIPPGELLLKRKDGSLVPVLSSHALLSPVGRPPEFFCLDVDLTERKKAEDLLSYAISLTDASLESTAEGILVVNRNGEIARWNKKFAELWKVPEELLVTGVKDPVLAHITAQMSQPDRFLAKVMELYEHPDASSQDLLALADGRFFDRYSQPLEIGDEIVGRFWSFRDVTEHKKHQQEQLKIEKLESLGLLAGGIAHDFNNILTGVMGNISFAQMFLDPSHKACKPLEEAEKASLRATELAHQLLTFARGGEPIRKIISLQHIVNESVELVLSGSNVKGFIDIPDTTHAVDADEGQLSQVLHNILINASQAMPGGGTLTISAQNETIAGSNTLSLPPGSYVRLSITDQGCGMPEDVMAKVFDPYFTTKSAGNGLGLASAYSIIARHGGHIGVESVVAQGTTFTIHLPSIGETYSSHNAETAAKSRAEQHNGGSILVMDDEAMIRAFAERMLSELGYQVTTCSDGAEAITLYKKALQSGSAFTAVIMDLTIPGGMGGKDAAQQILAVDAAANLIVSSGYSNDPIMADYQAYGFSAAVAKPYRINDLGQILISLLNR
ncbi:PAS domain S-box protein [Geomonas sp. Red69]|uniref:PAS domain S-box protein n=1 Tax=Geomonas diazotrophica TaxID=2843197 RepID=UPI001C117378|nr:PAS domain S-box protein [Geomonas diazotrophica]MBU5638966.1 PAS domain S-box protein [Geomonas diazotrophica]